MRNTIIPSYSDMDRMRAIFKVAPDTRIYAKPDHTIVYMENKNERFIAADRWHMSVPLLGEFMQENGDKYSYTSPSSFAMSLYRRKFSKSSFVMQGGDYRSAFCRDALYGGRCEVYKYGREYLYQYDINSSYPDSATKLTFPVPNKIVYAKPDVYNIMRYEGASQVVFTQDMEIPILPLRYMNRVVYAKAEHATGNYTHTELRYAMEMGVTIHKVVKQYIAEEVLTDNPFDDFVNYCYGNRINTGLKIWKVIANGLFGRLATVNTGLLLFRAASKRDQMVSRPKYLKDYFGLCCYAEEMVSPPDANTLWAAMILAHARIKLHQKVDFFDTHYIDTDCVIKTRKIPEIPLSDKLGDFKLKEGNYDIRGAKQYSYENQDGDVIIKLKGVPEQHQKSRFFAAQFTQERLLNEDGTTRPLEIHHDDVFNKKG